MLEGEREALRDIVARDFGRKISEEYGGVGDERLVQIGRALERIYATIAPELLAQGMTVIAPLDPTQSLLAGYQTFEVTASDLPDHVRDAATLEILGGSLYRCHPATLDPLPFAEAAVVYHYDGSDAFVVGGSLVPLPRQHPFASWWSVPSFFEVDAALDNYRTHVALDCDCETLEGVWHDPDYRLRLVNKPEGVMQRSLWRYLRQVLRGAERVREVDREQPVDGLRPPDIKITFATSNRLALIEVKWIGKSVSDDGSKISRFAPDVKAANDGASQLAAYLDANRPRAPRHQTMGYLVVFDARRRGVRIDSTVLPSGDAFAFEYDEIPFDPDLASTRYDFAPPVRCYMRPRQQPR